MRNRNFLTATTLLSSLLFTLPGIQAQAQETTNHLNYSHNIDSSAANSAKFFLIDNGVDPKTADTLIKPRAGNYLGFPERNPSCKLLHKP